MSSIAARARAVVRVVCERRRKQGISTPIRERFWMLGRAEGAIRRMRSIERVQKNRDAIAFLELGGEG